MLAGQGLGRVQGRGEGGSVRGIVDVSEVTGGLEQVGAGEPGCLSKAGLELGRKEFFVDMSSMTCEKDIF